MQYVLIDRVWVKLTSNYLHHTDKHEKVKHIRVLSKKEIEQMIMENK